MSSFDLPSVASDAFAFLVADFGFVERIVGPEHVRFEGNGAFVDVRFDAHRSFELVVELGRLRAPAPGAERTFNLGEVLRAAGSPEAADLACVQVVTSGALERFTRRMAEVLRIHGAPLLRGEQEAYERLEAQSDRESRAYEHQKDLEYAIRDAREAWSRGDHPAVVSALEPFEPELPPSERKRLEVSRARR